MILNLSANKVAAQRELINAIRDAKEILAVDVTISLGSYSVDCDPVSINRMTDTLFLWSTFGITSIDWVMADNSGVTLTETELTDLHLQAVVQRGIRSAQLHSYASTLKATLPVADNHTMLDGDTWPL